jgi:hypothetical protein
MRLTKHERAWSRDGSGVGATVSGYRVGGGLPVGEEALLSSSNLGRSWQFLRIRNDKAGEWRGDYATADDALAGLEAEIDDELHKPVAPKE